ETAPQAVTPARDGAAAHQVRNHHSVRLVLLRFNRIDTGEQVSHRGQLGDLGGAGLASGPMRLEFEPVRLFEQPERVGRYVRVPDAHSDTSRSARTSRRARMA